MATVSAGKTTRHAWLWLRTIRHQLDRVVRPARLVEMQAQINPYAVQRLLTRMAMDTVGRMTLPVLWLLHQSPILPRLILPRLIP